MGRGSRSDRVFVDLGELGLDEAAFEPVEAGQDDDVGPGTDERPDPAVLARTRARRVRRGVVAGLAALLVLSAWGATTEIDGHRRTERLLTAQGGVLSLAEAPRVAWTAGTDSANATAFMPGLVVVRRGTVLHGLDAGTGAERWQVDVGGDPRCDASGAVVDPLVCWGGPNAAPRVTVVHTDGSSTTRALAADVVWAAGIAEGALVTLRPAGGAPTTGARSNGAGQDVVLRMEDAATGAPEWLRNVPFRTVSDPWTCGSISAVTGGAQSSYTFTTSPPALQIFGQMVEVDGCGVRAAFTPKGLPTADAGQSTWWLARPYVDGGVLEQVGGYQGDTTVASVLHAADGSVLATYPKQVLNPWATDGTHSDLVLAGSAGVPLTAYGPGGTVRWQSVHPYGQLLVRASGVAVLTGADGGIAGVDVRTGRELWRDPDLLSGASNQAPPRAAFTDGRFMALQIDRDERTTDATSGQPATTELVGVDLATGQVRWRTDLPTGGTSLVAVEGHLVDTAQQSYSALRADGPGGAPVDHSPGTVQAFG